MKPNYKDSVSGIYCIRNISTGKMYIGKSKNIYKRIHQHIYSLNRKIKKSENAYIQNAWDKYGKDDFEYSVLEILDLDENTFKEREMYWINFFKSTDRKFGYNLRMDSSSNMITHEETSIKISNRLKKEWESGIRSEHGAKLSKYWENNSSRKLEQSKMLSEIKTKYVYYVYDSNMNLIIQANYKKLVEMKIHNVIGKFHETKKDECTFKNYYIKRVKIEDIVQSS